MWLTDCGLFKIYNIVFATVAVGKQVYWQTKDKRQHKKKLKKVSMSSTWKNICTKFTTNVKNKQKKKQFGK